MNLKALYVLPIITTLFLSGCGGDPSVEEGSGSSSTDITDAASDKFSQVWVDIAKITAVHKETGNVEDLTIGTEQGAFDLLSLRDVSERLATVKLPEGEYSDIKVTLTPNSKIVVFDLQGEKKEVELASQVLPMTSDFTIVKDGSTTLAIDFDVDQWETHLSAYDPQTSSKLPVASLPIVKSIGDKGVLIKQSGVLTKEGTDLFLDLPAQDFKYKLSFGNNTETSGFTVGNTYEIEGLLTDGELAVDEIESQVEEEEEQAKVISEKIKIYGIIDFVNTDDNDNVTSAQVKIKKSSKMLDTMSVNVILDGLEPVKYVNTTIGSAALEAGSRVKILGELLSTSMEDITAYTVIVKNGDIKPKVVRKRFSSIEMVKCVTADNACEIHSSSTNFGKLLVIDPSRLEASGSTKRCFDTGEFIGTEVKGRLSVDESTIYVKALKSEQRCEEETTFVKGYLTNYTTTSCASLDNDDAVVELTGKMEVVSFTDTAGNTSLLKEDEILFKIRRSNGALRIKSDTTQANKAAVYDFLSLSEDVKTPGMMAVGGDVYVYSDVSNIGPSSIADAVLTTVSVGGYIEVTNAMGEVVVLRPLNKSHHKKAVECTFELTDENGVATKTITTNGQTKWLGKRYRFEDARKIKAVVSPDDVNPNILVAKSIRFGKLLPSLSSGVIEKETLQDLLDENLDKGNTESDADYGQRMTDFQIKLKEALRDTLKGGLDDDKLGDKKHNEKESKSDRERKYEDKRNKKDTLKKKTLNPNDLYDFVEDMSKLTKDIQEEIEDNNQIRTKSDVINKMSDRLKELAKAVEKTLGYYQLPATMPADIQELIDSLGDISKLYDVFNKHEPFFDEDKLKEEKGEFGDDRNDDEKKGVVSADKITVDGVEYTLTFPVQAMGHYGTLDFTDWELVKVVDTLDGAAGNKYYLEIDEDISARTGSFTITGVSGEIIIKTLEVTTTELGSKIHDLETPNLKAGVNYYQLTDINGVPIPGADKELAIYITYNYGLDSEINYDYQLKEGTTFIFNQLSKDTKSIRIYNFDPENEGDGFMEDFYTDITYETKHSDIKFDKINFDINLRTALTPTDANGERHILEEVIAITGVASIDGKPYTVFGNSNHIIMERETGVDADGNPIIDRLVTQMQEKDHVRTLDENGKRDTDNDEVTDKQYQLNGVPLANWIYDRTPNDLYLIKRYGQNLAMLKLDATDATTPTNFYLNGREYPMDAITFTRIKERAGLLHVSPYSKKRSVALDTGTEDIHQATEIVIDLQNGRLRTITDTITPKDKVTIRENEAPVANADTATVDEDGSITIDVLANDTDADGDTLSIVSATATNGSVEITQ